jgi:hypothetical protein
MVRARGGSVGALPSFKPSGSRRKIYYNPSKTRAGIVACGGLCPGLNDVIRGLVRNLMNHYGARRVVGFRNGYQGFRRLLPARGSRLDTASRSPRMGRTAGDNRNLLIRVTRFIASHAGIIQFLDCGLDYPPRRTLTRSPNESSRNVHVIYVGNALWCSGTVETPRGNDQTHFSAADIFEPSRRRSICCTVRVRQTPPSLRSNTADPSFASGGSLATHPVGMEHE